MVAVDGSLLFDACSSYLAYHSACPLCSGKVELKSIIADPLGVTWQFYTECPACGPGMETSRWVHIKSLAELLRSNAAERRWSDPRGLVNHTMLLIVSFQEFSDQHFFRTGTTTSTVEAVLVTRREEALW